MDAKRLQKLRAELGAYLNELMPDQLGNRRRRRWAEVYVRGLLLDGARKSIEPMARRLEAIDHPLDPGTDYEQAMQQLVNQSPWEDRGPRDRLAHHVVATVGVGGALLLDDTGFPKQGTHSVGVARQYSGTLGKIGNCQVAVTLQYATERAVFCLDAALYLPKEWTEDPQRLRAAGVPAGIGYQPKWKIALALLTRAQANGLSGPVLADSAYGDVTEFRDALEAAHWAYSVGISSTLKVVAAEHDFGAVPVYQGRGRPPSRPAGVRARAASEAVKDWAQQRPRDFRKVTWREGSKGKMSSRFAAWRVRPAHGLSAGAEPRAACWLLAEWPEGEAAPTKFFFSNLPPDTSVRQLVRTTKSRWWVEHSYKEMKDEMGLDHFEGRGWTGWHHHVTLVLLAYAFVVLHRQRRKKGVPSG
jgi:SRSO17 transposase